MCMTLYRVFHDFMSELQEVILSEKIIHMDTFSEYIQE